MAEDAITRALRNKVEELKAAARYAQHRGRDCEAQRYMGQAEGIEHAVDVYTMND